MNRIRGSKMLTAGITAAAATSLVVAGLSIAGGVASADPRELVQTYDCPFPLIGVQPVKTTIQADIPATLPVGQPTPEFVINVEADAGTKATEGLNVVGAKTIEGEGTSFVKIAGPGLDLPLEVPVTIPSNPIPANGTPLVLKGIVAKAPSISVDKPGTYTIDVTGLKLKMTPKKADGTPTGLGTFDSACNLQAGMPTKLAEIQATGGGTTPPPTSSTTKPPTSSTTPPTSSTQPPTSSTTKPPTSSTTPPTSSTTTPPTTNPPPGLVFKGDLKGSTFVKAPNGTAPLSGNIVANVDLGTGKYTADLVLNPTEGSFKIMGFLPVTTKISFQIPEKTTGVYGGDKLTAHATFITFLNEVKAFGFPIGGGAECRTVNPSTTDLTASPFDITKGGKLKGEYSLDKLQGCGQLNDFISPFTAGSGNTIDMDLTPTN